MPFSFTSLFRRKNSTVDKVTDFTEAYEWIETYKKAKEYETAQMAGRELLLKIRTSVNYYVIATRKIEILTTSNIDTIATAARAKLKIVKEYTEKLTRWENKISALLKEIENLHTLKKEKIARENTQAQLTAEIK